jgi:hypothetical protein
MGVVNPLLIALPWRVGEVVEAHNERLARGRDAS